MPNKMFLLSIKDGLINKILIQSFKLNGKKSWTLGYNEYKWNEIESSLNNKSLMNSFRRKEIPKMYGIGIDERIVEYPWVFANMTTTKGKYKILDAGSVFNYSKILNIQLLRDKSITIFNYNPEKINFNEKGVSYIYGDLREIPFKDKYFNKIVCQSTLEHIDMDNSIYGYNVSNSSNNKNKSYEYLKVIEELFRVLNRNSELLITFPFGKYENHIFFQQFDSEMLLKIKQFFNKKGVVEINFIKYTPKGWTFSSENECSNVVSYNPHTGKGWGDDGAAHCRAICCIKFIKI